MLYTHVKYLLSIPQCTVRTLSTATQNKGVGQFGLVLDTSIMGKLCDIYSF